MPDFDEMSENWQKKWSVISGLQEATAARPGRKFPSKISIRIKKKIPGTKALSLNDSNQHFRIKSFDGKVGGQKYEVSTKKNVCNALKSSINLNKRYKARFTIQELTGQNTVKTVFLSAIECLIIHLNDPRQMSTPPIEQK